MSMSRKATSFVAEHPSFWHWVALSATMAIALAVRLWHLDTLPPGLYRDEATNGLDALRVIAGEHPLYFTANNGREPLFMYLLALSVRLLGRTPGALRLVAAVLGTLTVLVSYWLGHELYGRRVGLVFAVLLSVTVWPVNLSRIALRAVGLPLFIGAMLALTWLGLRRHSIWPMAAAGLCWGLSFYTYLAARFTLLALPLVVLYLWRLRPDARWWRGWLTLASVAFAVAMPLGVYIVTHWQATMGRAGQVSVFDSAISQGHPWVALLRNLMAALLGPFLRGDFIPRHNVPLRPAFGPLMAPFGLVGLALMLARVRRDSASGMVLIWCGVMAVPTVLAEGAPHFLRAVGVLPLLFLLPSVGLDWAAAQLSRWRRWLPTFATVAVLLIAGTTDLLTYWRHLNSQAVYYNFESGATALAAQVNRFLGRGWPGQGLAVPQASDSGAGRVVALDSRFAQNWPSVSYLISAQERVIDLERVDADTPTPLALAIWPYGDALAIMKRLPEGHQIDVQPGAWERGDLEAEARQLYIWIEDGTNTRPTQPLTAAWADGIHLDGYTVERASGRIAVALWWRADAPIDRDYTVFCQAIIDGRLVGQADSQPALGLAPTSQWHRYGGVVDRHIVSVDNEDVARAELYVGLYDLATMERLPLASVGGIESTDTYLVLR